jgi:hypothetical protein
MITITLVACLQGIPVVATCKHVPIKINRPVPFEICDQVPDMIPEVREWIVQNPHYGVLRWRCDQPDSGGI